MVDLKELDKLQTLIESEPLMWGCCKRIRIFDGQQILFCEPKTGKVISDAVCHKFSYGGNTGLLEQRQLLPDYIDDDVEGWLTAEKIFERWKKYFNERVIPF
jgi:hypothetical protein